MAISLLLPFLAVMDVIILHLSQAGQAKCGQERNIQIENGVAVHARDLVTFGCKEGYLMRRKTVLNCRKEWVMGRLPRC